MSGIDPDDPDELGCVKHEFRSSTEQRTSSTIAGDPEGTTALLYLANVQE